jgi:hypothetical protein
MMKNIYFNEYNLLMGSGGIVYLPFVSGILSSYLKTSRKIVEKYRVMPFIFVPNTVENILREYNNPNVACFSISMWNEASADMILYTEDFPIHLKVYIIMYININNFLYLYGAIWHEPLYSIKVY